MTQFTKGIKEICTTINSQFSLISRSQLLKMLRLKIFSIFASGFLLIAISAHQIEMKTKFISDVLSNENIPSTIVVKASCWSNHEIIAFSRAIKNFVQFSKDNVVMNEPFDEHSNKIWFFVDIKCEGSLEYVTMVSIQNFPAVDSVYFEFYSTMQTDPLFYGSPYRWIFYNVTEDHMRALENLPFLTDSNVLIAQSKEPNVFILTQCK